MAVKLRPQGLEDAHQIERDDQENWSTIIASGANAVHESIQGPMQVVVLEHRHTPHGLMYEITPLTEQTIYDPASTPARKERFAERRSPKSGLKWSVSANTVQPIPGETKMIRMKELTGESKSFI